MVLNPGEYPRGVRVTGWPTSILSLMSLFPTPSLAPILATLIAVVTLTLILLRPRGLDVSAWAYARVGLLVTPPALLAAILALLLTTG